MTRDEKAQEAIDALSRDEKEERIRDSMWNWDTHSLVISAWNGMGLEDISDSDFDDEYYVFFFHEFEEPEYDDDEIVDAIFEEPLKCVCGGFGAHSDWCDLVTGEHSPGAY